MGYHVAIIRTKAGAPHPITRDEVLRALPALNGRLAQHAGRPGELDLVDPAKGEASELLLFHGGELWADTPGDDFIALMIALADQMGARVRGDELETYRSVDDAYSHPDDAQLIEAARAASAARGSPDWNEWKARLKTVGVFMGIGLVIIVAVRLSRML